MPDFFQAHPEVAHDILGADSASMYGDGVYSPDLEY